MPDWERCIPGRHRKGGCAIIIIALAISLIFGGRAAVAHAGPVPRAIPKGCAWQLHWTKFGNVIRLRVTDIDNCHPGPRFRVWGVMFLLGHRGGNWVWKEHQLSSASSPTGWAAAGFQWKYCAVSHKCHVHYRQEWG